MTPERARLTDSQRRRAEALILVHALFPGAPSAEVQKLAYWICTGRLPGEGCQREHLTRAEAASRKARLVAQYGVDRGHHLSDQERAALARVMEGGEDA
jgi:hypothetical protein